MEAGCRSSTASSEELEDKNIAHSKDEVCWFLEVLKSADTEQRIAVMQGRGFIQIRFPTIEA